VVVRAVFWWWVAGGPWQRAAAPFSRAHCHRPGGSARQYVHGLHPTTAPCREPRSAWPSVRFPRAASWSAPPRLLRRPHGPLWKCPHCLSCPRSAGPDQSNLFQASLIAPAHPSSGCRSHRTDLRDCRNGDTSGRCSLGGHCTTSYDLVKIVLGQHPFSANFAAREPASAKLVGKPARLAAENGSRLIEGEKKWCCRGHGGQHSWRTERTNNVGGRCLLSLPCSRRPVLERPSDAPLPIQRPKHVRHITPRHVPLPTKTSAAQRNSALLNL